MSLDPGPVVAITLREIYEAVTRLTGRVDVLIAQHDATVRDQQEHERASAATHADFEARLRTLERARWPLPSLAAAVSLVAIAITLIPLIR